MTETKDRNDLEIIFSEDEVNLGFKTVSVKPWTLKQLIGIWPLLTVLLQTIQASAGLEGPTSVPVSELFDILTKNLQAVIQIVLPHLPKFFSLSILNLTEEEAMEIDGGVSTVLLLKILSKNITHLKNSLSLVVVEMAALTGAMTQPNMTPTPSLE